MVATRLYRTLEQSSGLLGASAQRRCERWLRGWLEAQRLTRSDVAVVSFGKSGRTWLRVMLSHVFAQRLDHVGDELLSFDGNDGTPALLFTHDNYLGDYSGHRGSKADYRNHGVLLLVRDPADTAVSQYFQWRFRMRDHKKMINGYPRCDGDALSLFDFVVGEAAGLPKIFRFMNEWAAALSRIPRHLVVRYEDLRTDTPARLREICAFLGVAVSDAEIAQAVEYARLENMRQREAEGAASSPRLRAADVSNPDSFKTRRAKVGGYRDYFTDEQVQIIDQAINTGLSPVYGYHRAAPVAEPA